MNADIVKNIFLPVCSSLTQFMSRVRKNGHTILFYNNLVRFKYLDRVQRLWRLYTYNITQENMQDFHDIMDILGNKYKIDPIYEETLDGVYQHLEHIDSQIRNIIRKNKQIFNAIPKEDMEAIRSGSPFLNLSKNLVKENTVSAILSTLSSIDDRSN